MKKAIIVFIQFTFVFMLNACKKENPPNIDINAFLDCNAELNLDTVASADRLVGKWELKYWYCGACYNPGYYNPDKKFVVTFNSANTYTITENYVVVDQGNWSINFIGTNKRQLVSTNKIDHTSGILLFCDNKLLFSDGYNDGTDNLFEKAD